MARRLEIRDRYFVCVCGKGGTTLKVPVRGEVGTTVKVTVRGKVGTALKCLYVAKLVLHLNDRIRGEVDTALK